MPDYITTEEAAEILGYHIERIREMARAGILHADKKGRTWWVYRDSVVTYKEAVRGKSKHDPTRGH